MRLCRVTTNEINGDGKTPIMASQIHIELYLPSHAFLPVVRGSRRPKHQTRDIQQMNPENDVEPVRLFFLVLLLKFLANFLVCLGWIQFLSWNAMDHYSEFRVSDLKTFVRVAPIDFAEFLDFFVGGTCDSNVVTFELLDSLQGWYGFFNL
jgi:hypothetical protein